MKLIKLQLYYVNAKTLLYCQGKPLDENVL